MRSQKPYGRGRIYISYFHTFTSIYNIYKFEQLPDKYYLLILRANNITGSTASSPLMRLPLTIGGILVWCNFNKNYNLDQSLK